ncbi:hypothetical protein [Streptomyces rimosus]|uniref:hypothetical protein n=1 Tax=Streptomyces rimosus TaxID=1927 RepID=UPI00379B6BD7
MAEAPASAPGEWSTISLAKFLRDALFTPPSQRKQPLQARGRITEALKALTGRGLDGHAFVRYGLGAELAERIAGLASLPQLFSLVAPGGANGEVDELLSHVPQEVTPWTHLCKADIASISAESRGTSNPEGLLLNSVMELTHDWNSRVHTWAQRAAIHHLIDWECPTDYDFNALVDGGAPESELESCYGWLVDRLTGTYLSDWKTSSLHHEYRWLKAAAPTPFADKIMGLRHIKPVDLNAEISERAVMSQGDEAQRETVAQLSFQGAQLVKSGNHDAAAATFRLITKIAPGDASARNDLGFSLVPNEPRKALRHLTTATKMGYDQPFINAHNRMVCNLLIGSPKEALYIAENAWASAKREQAIPAILWSWTGDRWIAQNALDARVEVARLALHAAQTLGESAQETWQSRLSSLLPEDAF